MKKNNQFVENIVKRHRKELENIDLKKEIEDLKHQLAEKEKEIKRLKSCVLSKEQVEEIAKQEIKNLTKTIYETCRHQVCAEIRENLKKYSVKHLANYIIEIEETRLDLLIDQIEKGEKEC